jgi:hypothetical protein
VQGLQVGDLVVKDNSLLLAREFRIAKGEAHKQQNTVPTQTATNPK